MTTISIGIGVGVNVAIYSVLRTLLTPGMTATAPETTFGLRPGLSYPKYVDFRTNDAFVDLVAMQASTPTYRTGETTTTIGARVVGENFFEVLALETALAHLEAIDPRGAQVVVLRFYSGLSVPRSQSIWGSQPGVLNGCGLTRVRGSAASSPDSARRDGTKGLIRFCAPAA